MDKSTLVRCLIVSFLIAVPASFLTATMYSATLPSENVMDLSYLDAEITGDMSEDEFFEYIQTIPYRSLAGFDKFLYWTTHPQALYFKLISMFNWFVGVFVATIAVSYWNSRHMTSRSIAEKIRED